MLTPDQGLDKLKLIQHELKEYKIENGYVTEADTRAKVIDRVLKEGLGWPEGQLTREKYVPERGYQDYVLTVRGKRYITVEAKRDGIPFTLPGKGTHKYLKLSGALLTDPEIKEAIHQVRSYCSEEGIRFAVATNGNSWIVFRACREDIPWKSGQALVFPSFDYIITHFTEFWNCLAFESISNGSLDLEFGSQLRIDRQLHRVIDILHAADSPLQRNRLYAPLRPLVTAIFEDIADQAEIEILKSCYVHSRSLQIVAQELGGLIKDEIPLFLKQEGAIPIEQKEEDSGKFGQFVENATDKDEPFICLILGGIGSGKTTFLKRYQRTVGEEVLTNNTLWFSINFLNAKVDSNLLESFVWDSILDQLKTRYHDKQLETRKTLKNAYKSEIRSLKETVLRNLSEGSEEYENTLSPYLERWKSDTAKHIPKLLSIAKPHRGIKIVLFFDNVDQLSPDYQAKIFLLAQGVTETIRSITVVALREESYYTASVQNVFTAYTNHKFHIASPLFISLIKNRIDYTKKVIAESDNSFAQQMEQRQIQEKKDITEFLIIVQNSVLEASKGIVYFIEALCFGNMRLGLEMFTTFLTSGATDVGKMLYVYNRQGFYDIAYHEFVKSVMLGDRKYYKESASPIMNVFDCGIEKNSSHFTTLRILNLLINSYGTTSLEGRGYFSIGQARALFEDIFDNAEDFIRCLDRLVRRQLVELNTRSTESSSDASHVRITSSGWYYSVKLSQTFVYLDLVLQDTPLNERELANELQRSVYKVNNLHDQEADKIARVNERTNRVQRFIDYLAEEERFERERYGLTELDSFMSATFTESIQNEFRKQSEWIKRRLQENQNRATEDSFFRLSDEETTMLGLVKTQEEES